jgi:steroid 5-alpha reductase family enzyme
MLPEFLKFILLAWIFAAALMAVVWFISLRIDNFGIIDIAWSLAFTPIAVFFALCAPGFETRRWLISAMVAAWSLRLGIHVAVRVIRAHPNEDPRYKEFREKWKKNLDLKMFVFFQIQALSVVALAIPFLIVCFNQQSNLNVLEWIGFALWLISVAGESVADHQLKKFKANPANKNEVCRIGLWHYSRHPNYFFEWLVWIAYWIFALGSPLGCAAVYCPALMLYFLLRVTGIPLTERQSLKSKGEKFRAYQRTTSMFVPLFPKNNSAKNL